MTILRKTPPKISVLGIGLTILALASGTWLTHSPASVDETAAPVQPVQSAPAEAPTPPATSNG